MKKDVFFTDSSTFVSFLADKTIGITLKVPSNLLRKKKQDMCKVGGGPQNRCLAHNPASKYVVKVVTTKTKADETTVKKTLAELNKEGKNLPTPAPETVKTWVDTERFATQYDPALTEHERRIQLNRLDNTEVESVNGGHFHAWKNLQKAVRSKVGQRVAAGSLIIGMSASLVGCFASDNNADNNNNAPINPPTSTSAPAEPTTPASSPDTFGNFIGSGEKVETDDGSYETITVNPDAPVYTLNNGQGLPAGFAESGWTEADAEAGQKFAVDYVVSEFIDSKALETGESGYQEWFATSAPKYFSDNMLNAPTVQTPDEAPVILGNFAGRNVIPNLIHDGTPREKGLQLTMLNAETFPSSTGQPAMKFNIEYIADYRLDDASAAEFGSYYTNQTPEQFLSSPNATEKVKDGSGENVYSAYGTVGVVVVKNNDGGWEMIGLQTETNYSTIDFAVMQ